MPLAMHWMPLTQSKNAARTQNAAQSKDAAQTKMPRKQRYHTLQRCHTMQRCRAIQSCRAIQGCRGQKKDRLAERGFHFDKGCKRRLQQSCRLHRPRRPPAWTEMPQARSKTRAQTLQRTRITRHVRRLIDVATLFNKSDFCAIMQCYNWMDSHSINSGAAPRGKGEKKAQPA